MGQLYIKEIAVNIIHIFIGLLIFPVNLKHPWSRFSQIMRPPARHTFWEITSEDYGLREYNSKLMAQD